MKQTMKRHSFTSQLKSLALVFGIALAFASCANEDVAQNPTNPNDDNDKNLTTFVAGEEAKTRTSMDYTSGNFYWEAGDYIYVKDDDGTLQKSSNAPASKVAAFKYKVPGKFSASSSYKVYYLGKYNFGGGNSVSILTVQRQTAPDNTEHFGTAGDYGTATANKVTGKNQFKFELEHLPAYLVFQPYTSNTILQNCYLTKVEVTSDNDIAETYTVNPTTGALDASTVAGGGKEITLYTQDWTSGSSYSNGFPLTNSTASVTTNGAYMVIKPGTHTLRVRYWVKDVATNVEGTITKTYPSTAYASNTYYDMKANLDVKNYDGDHYYMWDAEKQYWKGHEWNLGGSQPTLPTQSASSDYPQSSGDTYNRWYHEGGGSGEFNATQSCAGLPNVNEMIWYAVKGDPHWDETELWTTMGHLCQGGMWFKKKAYISGYNANTDVDGIDRRYYGGTTSSSSIVSSGLPDVADAGNYFYLPAMGGYSSGQLNYRSGYNLSGNYWSSSAHPWHRDEAYRLHFGWSSVTVLNENRNNGFSVGAFE